MNESLEVAVTSIAVHERGEAIGEDGVDEPQPSVTLSSKNERFNRRAQHQEARCAKRQRQRVFGGVRARH
jgi:hypothetical protein